MYYLFKHKGINNSKASCECESVKVRSYDLVVVLHPLYLLLDLLLLLELGLLLLVPGHPRLHHVLDDRVEVLEVLLDEGELGFGVDSPLLEHVEVLGVLQVYQLLERVFEGALLFAVEAALLEIVNGHEDARQVTHLTELLRARLLRLALQLVLLVLYRLKSLLQLRNVVV